MKKTEGEIKTALASLDDMKRNMPEKEFQSEVIKLIKNGYIDTRINSYLKRPVNIRLIGKRMKLYGVLGLFIGLLIYSNKELIVTIFVKIFTLS